MKVAIVGSRGLSVSPDILERLLPPETREIVSGGAKGVDTDARNFALDRDYLYTEFLPEYQRFGKSAPLKRNLLMLDYADFVLIFWDKESHGTKYVLENCQKKNIPHRVFATLPETEE